MVGGINVARQVSSLTRENSDDHDQPNIRMSPMGKRVISAISPVVVRLVRESRDGPEAEVKRRARLLRLGPQAGPRTRTKSEKVPARPISIPTLTAKFCTSLRCVPAAQSGAGLLGHALSPIKLVSAFGRTALRRGQMDGQHKN